MRSSCVMGMDSNILRLGESPLTLQEAKKSIEGRRVQRFYLCLCVG